MSSAPSPQFRLRIASRISILAGLLAIGVLSCSARGYHAHAKPWAWHPNPISVLKQSIKSGVSQPELDPLAQRRRELGVEQAAHFLRMIACAEVRADDQLVLEPVRTLDEIVEVHVAELVDLLAAVVGA